MRHSSIIGLGWGLGLVACSPPSTTQADGDIAPRAVAPDPQLEPTGCRPSPGGGAWARFPGTKCGWELRDEGERLILASLVLEGALEGSPPVARGEVPEACRTSTCVYYGVWSPAGPVLLAVVPSSQSEMPSDVLLGVTHGEQLGFASLWDGAGEPVDSELTRVGPVHALAPFSCGGALALLAVERIDAAGSVPPATLLAREGRLDPAAWVAAPNDVLSAGPVDRASCRALDLPVP